MKNKSYKTDKIKQLIEIAVENGWPLGFGGWEHFEIIISGVGFWDGDYENYMSASLQNKGEKYSLIEILFNHDFAKAIWGEEEIGVEQLIESRGEISWKHHLQQAVISDDPLEYYWENKPKEL